MRVAASLLALLLPLPLLAADATPEIRRDAIKPQAVGVVHTLRTIPEACARIEGLFTGKAADPYKFSMVRTGANCQARARFVDAAKAKPSEKGGWKFNDLIRVPNAACPSQLAVVRVWRKPVDAAPPNLDAKDARGSISRTRPRKPRRRAPRTCPCSPQRWRSKGRAAGAEHPGLGGIQRVAIQRVARWNLTAVERNSCGCPARSRMTCT